MQKYPYVIAILWLVLQSFQGAWERNEEPLGMWLKGKPQDLQKMGMRYICSRVRVCICLSTRRWGWNGRGRFEPLDETILGADLGSRGRSSFNVGKTRPEYKGKKMVEREKGVSKIPFFLPSWKRKGTFFLFSNFSSSAVLEGRITRHHESVESESGNGVFVVWCRSSLGGGGSLWIDHIFSKGLDVDKLSNPLIERELQTWEDVEGSPKNCRVLSTSRNISGHNVATYRYVSIYNAMIWYETLWLILKKKINRKHVITMFNSYFLVKNTYTYRVVCSCVHISTCGGLKDPHWDHPIYIYI